MKNSLAAFRENARQFNLAIEEAKKQRASILEYTDITGTTFRRYWNGAAFVDRENALFEKDRTGVYKASYNPLVDERLTETLRIRLNLDLDGTAAVFKKIDTLETLYEEGYFLNLEPNQNVVDAIRWIIRNVPEVEVFVMSSVLSDSKYALQEKNQWIDKYLPEIDEEHRIFPPCGENKLDYIPGGVRETDLLLDDYTNNLTLWEPPARAIKLLNGINHTRETWRGNRLRYDKTAEELAQNIIDIALHGGIIKDAKPQENVLDEIVAKMESNLNDLSDLNRELRKNVGEVNKIESMEQDVQRKVENPIYFEYSEKAPKI